ncbi:hypothetical protein D5086_015519 [Populus alba]|uniref:Uncharacterized protein n=1 Tax=Populus alba TaxID=43335 RepID=A0ACC4BRE9_POPAL
MKRSSSCSSSSSSSSSSPYCVASESIQKPKVKRIRKNQKSNQGKSQKNAAAAAANSPNSGKRSSIYRGVTRHRWTGRFEAHLWDKSSWNNIQNKKGKQGAYDNDEAAAHTYDLAAIKYWGAETTLNFPIESYTTEIEEMQRVTREEYLASLRRKSSGFSRGVSKYRGVARHHHNGRWEARIGRVQGNKYLYLGTYSMLLPPCLSSHHIPYLIVNNLLFYLNVEREFVLWEEHNSSTFLQNPPQLANLVSILNL